MQTFGRSLLQNGVYVFLQSLICLGYMAYVSVALAGLALAVSLFGLLAAIGHDILHELEHVGNSLSDGLVGSVESISKLF